MTHNEIAKLAKAKTPCTAWDLFGSSGGTQCGNCLAYTTDHGKTWKHPSLSSEKSTK